jgi:hypothetical protein
VFLGIGLADAGGPKAVRAGGSLLCFAADVIPATRLVRRSQGSGVGRRGSR